MSVVRVKANKCLRCGHEWLPRTKKLGEAKQCPQCHSPYWHKERTVSIAQEHADIINHEEASPKVQHMEDVYANRLKRHLDTPLEVAQKIERIFSLTERERRHIKRHLGLVGLP